MNSAVDPRGGGAALIHCHLSGSCLRVSALSNSYLACESLGSGVVQHERIPTVIFNSNLTSLNQSPRIAADDSTGCRNTRAHGMCTPHTPTLFVLLQLMGRQSSIYTAFGRPAPDGSIKKRKHDVTPEYRLFITAPNEATFTSFAPICGQLEDAMHRMLDVGGHLSKKKLTFSKKPEDSAAPIPNRLLKTGLSAFGKDNAKNEEDFKKHQESEINVNTAGLNNATRALFVQLSTLQEQRDVLQDKLPELADKVSSAKLSAHSAKPN